MKGEDGTSKASGYKKQRFWNCSHFAFYEPNQIHPQVPQIVARIEEVLLTPEGIELVTPQSVGGQDVADLKNRLQRLVERLESEPDLPADRQSSLHQVLFLSRPDDPQTVQLASPVRNNKQDKNGRGTAFTQKFAYVTLDSLKRAQHTSDLDTV